MSKATHTPGPWKAYESSERCPTPAGCPIEVGTVRDGGRKAGTVCEMVAQGPGGRYDVAETWANARLLAAAPDLYSACKAALGMAADGGDPAPVIRKLEAAIRKAEGGEG